MGRVVEWKRLPAGSKRDCRIKQCGKDAFGLEALTRSHFPTLLLRRSEVLHRCLQRKSGTKEQSQRRVRSLILRMVSKEQPTDLKGRTRAQLIMARRTSLQPKAEYICADLSSRQLFPCSPAADHTLPVLIPQHSAFWRRTHPECARRFGANQLESLIECCLPRGRMFQGAERARRPRF